MARSLPVYYTHKIQVALTNGTSAVTELTNIPDSVRLRALSINNTDGSPAGVCAVNFYADGDGDVYLGKVSVVDMGSTDQTYNDVAPGAVGLGGFYVTYTGDSSSNTQEVIFAYMFEVLAS